MKHLNYFVWFLAGAGLVSDYFSPISGAVVIAVAGAVAAVSVVAEAKALGPVKEDVAMLVKANQAILDAHTDLVSRVAEIENKSYTRELR